MDQRILHTRMGTTITRELRRSRLTMSNDVRHRRSRIRGSQTHAESSKDINNCCRRIILTEIQEYGSLCSNNFTDKKAELSHLCTTPRSKRSKSSHTFKGQRTQNNKVSQMISLRIWKSLSASSNCYYSKVV